MLKLWDICLCHEWLQLIQPNEWWISQALQIVKYKPMEQLSNENIFFNIFYFICFNEYKKKWSDTTRLYTNMIQCGNPWSGIN